MLQLYCITLKFWTGAKVQLFHEKCNNANLFEESVTYAKMMLVGKIIFKDSYPIYQHHYFFVNPV